jgi:hypothetical protein
LETWIWSWWNDKQGELLALEPLGWFDEGQQDGNFLWCPPPAAANVVVEQLREARHKRPQCTHIVVVPRLMTGSWRKGMMKEFNLELTIPVGSNVWGASQHEALLIYVSFPLCRHPPWSLKKTRYLDEFCGELRGVWEGLPGREGLFCANFSVARGYYSPCRKAWCRKCYRTPAGLAFPIRTPKDEEEGFEHVAEGDQNRFKHASYGANGVCPFQCNLCHFRNIQNRNPQLLDSFCRRVQ